MFIYLSSLHIYKKIAVSVIPKFHISRGENEVLNVLTSSNVTLLLATTNRNASNCPPLRMPPTREVVIKEITIVHTGKFATLQFLRDSSAAIIIRILTRIEQSTLAHVILTYVHLVLSHTRILLLFIFILCFQLSY